jgi:antitoxin component HigA of HigAB toxin-antitoxin module
MTGSRALVEAWERKHYPLDHPDPVAAIKYHMDQNGLKPMMRRELGATTKPWCCGFLSV